MPDMTDHQRASMMRLSQIQVNAKPLAPERLEMYLRLIDRYDAETIRDAIDHLLDQGQRHLPDPGLLAETLAMCRSRRDRANRPAVVCDRVPPAPREIQRAGLAEAREVLSKVRP
jgi:hypothetical protein